MAKAPLINDILILTPSKEFIEIEIVEDGPATVRPGTPINIMLDIEEEGTYIIEINHQQGFAVLNRPIYAQEGIPIIPDFEARREPIRNIT